MKLRVAILACPCYNRQITKLSFGCCPKCVLFVSAVLCLLHWEIPGKLWALHPYGNAVE